MGTYQGTDGRNYAASLGWFRNLEFKSFDSPTEPSNVLMLSKSQFMVVSFEGLLYLTLILRSQ